MTPFRTNARPADPPPEEDTSEEWFAKLRADARRRARFVELGTLWACVGALLLGIVFIGSLVASEVRAENACAAAGGTYIRGRYLAVREIHP